MSGFADSLVGTKLGGYSVRRFIARGGMGMVFEGYQESLNRAVAIKVLYPHLSDEPSFRERFQREAQAIAQLRHPNIVRVIDYGFQDVYHFMVMELVDGESLRDRLVKLNQAQQQLPPDEALHIIQQVGAALSYAHAHGYLHRDVKPGNVMLDRDGSILLSDFGLVKLADGLSITATGGIVGTPEYMAPEQSLGVESVGPAADQYALGVVAYELFVGRVPFTAPTPVSLIQKHISEPPPSPRSIKPWFPYELEFVLLRSLAKNQTARYPSIEEFVGELQFATTSMITGPTRLDGPFEASPAIPAVDSTQFVPVQHSAIGRPSNEITTIPRFATSSIPGSLHAGGSEATQSRRLRGWLKGTVGAFCALLVLIAGMAVGVLALDRDKEVDDSASSTPNGVQSIAVVTEVPEEPTSTSPSGVAFVDDTATETVAEAVPTATDFPTPTPSTPPTTTSTPPPTASPAPTEPGPTATITPVPPTPTNAVPAPGTLLYEANWSSGLDGWSASQDWATVDGMLVNDGTNDVVEAWISAPVKLDEVRDYQVEVEMQILRLSSIACGDPSLGIVTRSGTDGQYWTGIKWNWNGYDQIPRAALAPVPMEDCGNSDYLVEKDFDPAGEWHKYRIEHRGNSISFLIDDVLVLQTSDNQYLMGGRVGLWSFESQANVRSFKVTAL